MPRRGWEIPEYQATPKDAFLHRRKFIKAAGLGTAGLLAGCGYEKSFEPFETEEEVAAPNLEIPTDIPVDRPLYPAPLNPAFGMLDRPLTDEETAARINNFYEFTLLKDVWRRIEDFEPRPWTLQVSGLVRNAKTYDVDALISKMPLEERLYRHRCVEAWSMAIPWTGFPMKALIDEVEPFSAARFVKMTSFLNPETAPGQWDFPQFPWPYVEGLSMEEATNELTMLATGVYGHELPKQHGAPIRLVTPWKYGFKGVKSIVSIEFTSVQPATFWNTIAPQEYGFFANVNPEVPHPRWSQASERFYLPDKRIERRPTLLYNGYEEYVGHIYG